MNKETLIKMEENKILELYKSGQSIKSLHKKFNLSERSISNYLKNSGIEIRKEADLLNYDIIEAKKLYENGKTLKEIAELFGCCRQSVSVQLKKLGVKVIRKDVMLDINETAFDNITTEEQSYWLGFFFADVNISKKNNYICVNLSGKDVDHLIKLKKFLNYKREINTYKTKQGYLISRLNVSNKHLWNRLNEIGCIPNKTNVLRFPVEVFNGDENLIRHFIRGYWDGDGCLTYRDKEHKRPSVNVISTNDFLREMEKHIPVTPKKTLRKKHESNDSIRIWEKEDKVGYKVAEYLYKDSTIYLKRKYDKYLEYCRLYEKS